MLAAVLVAAGGVSAQGGAAPAADEGPAADEDHGRRWYLQAPPDPQALRTDPEGHAELLAANGLLLDFEAGTISMRGAALHDRETLGYPIEYLVVTEHGKTHEAAFIVKARPSILNACLRALQLQPGEPTQVRLKDPLPPEEQIASGEASAWDVTSGHGPLVSITVDWIDDDGARHSSPLDGMLIDIRDGRPLQNPGWIFVGSRMGKLRQGRDVVETFMADIEGNIAAIYLDGRGTSLFERNSLKGIDDSLYTINPELMPPRGSPVTISFGSLGRSVDPPPAGPGDPDSNDPDSNGPDATAGDAAAAGGATDPDGTHDSGH